MTTRISSLGAYLIGAAAIVCMASCTKTQVIKGASLGAPKNVQPLPTPNYSTPVGLPSDRPTDLPSDRPSDLPAGILNVSIDAQARRRPIHPQIYGVSFLADSEPGDHSAVLSQLNVPIRRHGGNGTTAYNYLQNAHQIGSDWYFQSVPTTGSSAPGQAVIDFIAEGSASGTEAMVTVPMLDWVAKLGPKRSKLASFSIAKYGAQTDADWSWFPDAGNGVSTSGAPITGNDPHDACVPSSVGFQTEFVKLASEKGAKYFVLDNEHGLWHVTHRDIHPEGAKMEEVRDRMIAYAKMIRTNAPDAKIVGPEEWGWSGYFWSGFDQQHGYFGKNAGSDKAAHGNMDYIPWLLAQLAKESETSGTKLLDVFSLHYYPQGGEYSDNVSEAMQLLRNRSTRSLWDPNYTDTSWINDRVNLITRMRQWAAPHFPNAQLGITEYSWGADGHMNGATTQADILGIFGREGLDLATRWTTPRSDSPTFRAIQMYRNYDGRKSTFGDVSVAAAAPNPDQVSVFAAQRSLDQALTIMVINKQLSAAQPVQLNIAGFPSGGNAQVYQLSGSASAIRHLANVAYTGGALNATVPAQSITLYVLAHP